MIGWISINLIFNFKNPDFPIELIPHFLTDKRFDAGRIIGNSDAIKNVINSDGDIIEIDQPQGRTG